MTPRRALLVEVVDAIGAYPEDAHTRVRALEHAGLGAEAVALGGRVDPHAPEPSRRGVARGPEALAAAIVRRRPDMVLVAAAEPDGVASARRLTGDLPLRWWPTGIPARGTPRLGTPSVAPLALTGDGAEEGAGGLDGTASCSPRRAPLTLWDGDHVVVPGALQGASGRAVIEAFARAAGTTDALDLVVLDDPQPDFTRAARALGFATRLHFAGPATRDAEEAWYGAAAAVLVGSGRPVSGGLVLRALARGAPLIPVGQGAPAGPLRFWLSRHGCGWTPPDAPPADALERALERGPKVTRAIANGRALAAARTVESLGDRLAEALGSRARFREAA